MSSVTQNVFPRLAGCGHEYSARSLGGRARIACDECISGRLVVGVDGQYLLRCSVDGCDKRVPAISAQYCSAHYRRVQLYGSVAGSALDASRTCKKCTVLFAPKSAHQKFCSTACRLAARSDATRAARESTRRTCPQCGDGFTPESSLKQKFCSRPCQIRFNRYTSTDACIEPECNRQMVARGMCKMHWRRWARAEGMEKPPSWDKRRKANHQKRRALKMELPAESIRANEVYERDEWTCGICTKPVDRNAAWPDPKSPSLDHVIPLSKGGHHVMENVQLAHLDCNVRKGNRE